MSGNVVGEAVYDLSVDDSKFRQGLSNADRMADNTGKSIGKLGAIGIGVFSGISQAVTNMGLSMAGKAIGQFTSSIGDTINFGKQMNEVFTLMPDITDTAMKDMEGSVKSFSKQFGTLPDEVVPALYQAISAGVPQDNVFTFLETAQKAAIGGVTDLSTAVDGISSVVNAYGEEVLSATEASDLMFTAVKLGKTDFSQLSASLFQVIPTASALGVGFGDVTAGLAALTAQGVPTNVATTQMRQLFVELSKEGGIAAKTFQDLSGKTFKDFIASGGNTAEALDIMLKGAQDLDLGVNDLFGSVEAGSAALALAGSQTFVDNIEEMANSAGATDAAFAQMETGIDRAIAKIKANLAVWRLEIGSRLMPVIAALLGFVTNRLMPGLVSMAGVVERLLAPAFGLARRLLQRLQDSFRSISDGVTTFRQAISGEWVADDRITSFHLVIGRIGIAARSVISPLQSLVNGFRSFFAAIGTASSGGSLSSLTETFRELPGWVRPVVGVIAMIAANFRDFITVLNPGLSILRQLIVAFGRGGLQGAIDALPGIIGNVAGAYKNVFGILGDSLRTIGGLVLDAIQGVDWPAAASGLLDAAGKAIGGVDWASVAGTILGAIGVGLETVGSVAGSILGSLTTALGGIDWSSVGDTIAGGIGGALSTASDIGTTLFDAVWDAISGADWGKIGASIFGWIGDGLSTATDIGGTILDAIVTSIQAIGDFGTRVGGYLIEQITSVDWLGLGGTVLDAVVDGALAVANVATRFGTWFYEQFTSIEWTDIGGAILDGILAAVFAIGDVATRMGTWLYDTFTAIEWAQLGTSIVSGILTAVEAVADAATRIGTWLLGLFTSIDWSGIGNALQDGVATAIAGVTTIATAISDQISGFDWSGAGAGITSGIGGAIDFASGIDFSWLTGLIEPIMSAIQPLLDLLAPMLSIIKSNVDGMMGSFGELGKALGPLIQSFRNWMPLLKVVGAIIGAVVVVAVVALVLGVTTLARIIVGVVVAAIKLLTGVFETVGGIIKIVSGIITGMIDVVTKAIAGDWSGAWDAAKGIVTNTIDGIIIAVKGLPLAIIQVIADFVMSVIGFFKDMYNDLVGNSIVPDMINAIIQFFKDLVGDIPGIMLDFVAGVMGGFITLFIDAPKKIWDTVVAIKDEFVKLVTAGKEKAEEAVKAVVDELGELAGKIPGALIDVAQAIRDGLGGMITEAIQLGKDVISGFIEGIKEKAPDIGGAISGVTGAAQDGWDKLWGRDSPAKWTIDLAKDVMEGFAIGANQMSPEALDSINRFTSSAKQAFDTLASGLDLSAKLGEFVAPDAGLIGEIKTFVETVTREITWAANMFEGETLDHANRFSSAAGGAVALMSSAIDAVRSMSGDSFDLSAVTAMTSNLKFAIEHITRSIADSAMMFDDVALPRVEQFASAAQSALGLMTGVPEALRAMLQFGEDMDWTQDLRFHAENMSWLVWVIVEEIEAIAKLFQNEGLAAVETFSSAATAALGVMGAVGETIRTMLEFGDVSGGLNVDAMAGNLTKVIVGVTRAIESASATWSDAANPALEAFAADAGASLAIMRDVVDTITGMMSLSDANMKAGSIIAAIPKLSMIIEAVVEAIKQASDTFKLEGASAIQEFSSTAGGALMVMSQAVELVADIMTMKRMTQWNVDTFVKNWEMMIQAIERVAKIVETRGIGASQGILEDVQAIAAALKQATAMMGGMSDVAINANISDPKIATGGAPSYSGSSMAIGMAGESGSIIYGDVVTNVRIGDEPLRKIIRDVVNDTIRETI